MIDIRGLSLSLAALLGLAAPRSGATQQLATPPDWRWRLDHPARLVTGQDVPDSAWRFVAMPPGWHVTTGPGVVLYHPAEHASGRYSLAASFVLFPGPSESGFGLVLGGADLESGGADHITVDLRRDGALRVTAQASGQEHVLAPWRLHPAIRPQSGSDVVTNRLRVAVAPDSLRVFVNDSSVVAVAATGLGTDGQFGLRIGAGLNMHITTLDHIRHLAPGRR
jgi:hypothetical protein